MPSEGRALSSDAAKSRCFRQRRLLNTMRDAERAPPVPIAGDFSSSSRGLPLASPYFDVTPTEKLSIWPRKEANAVWNVAGQG